MMSGVHSWVTLLFVWLLLFVCIYSDVPTTTVRLESEQRQHEQAIQKMMTLLRALNRSLEAGADVKSDDYAKHRIEGHVTKFDEALKMVCWSYYLFFILYYITAL